MNNNIFKKVSRALRVCIAGTDSVSLLSATSFLVFFVGYHLRTCVMMMMTMMMTMRNPRTDGINLFSLLMVLYKIGTYLYFSRRSKFRRIDGCSHARASLRERGVHRVEWKRAHIV